ncbi:GDSL-type esterase/lipase family protein [Gordonia sp. OPL2]|uniref:SGNH/GDSL hydrolase family protein n=1 Tax=Gordonia sp. OPL2 TaxID=2486274 RepID=UPI00165636EA|nr:GDSL-type esterase/lipase family protein [Gordonia sp. OPL2]ROZ89031.1 hypothetical protein EEB19_20200 [Gordonia sp. OPL2]
MPDITFTLTDGFGSGTDQKKRISLQPAIVREDNGELVLIRPPQPFYGAPGVPQTVTGLAAGLWRVGDLDSDSDRTVLIDIPDQNGDDPIDIVPLILAELEFPENTTVQSLTQAVEVYLAGQDLLTADAAAGIFAAIDDALPTGGADGQVPVKTANGVAWQDPAAAEPIPGRAPLGNRLATLGDSVTIGGTSGGVGGVQNKGTAWPTFASILSGGRFELVRNAGVAGNTSAMMLARFDTDITPYAPDTVIVTAGTNDIQQDVPIATWKANIQAIVAKVRAIDAAPVLGAIYPSDAAVGRPAIISAWNIWLREYARAEGIPLIPFDQKANPATGGWPVGWSTDNVHPTLGNGPAELGKLVVDTLDRMLAPATIALPAWQNANQLTNGLFLTAGATKAAPTAPSRTPAVGTGSLAAGTYGYRVAARSRTGTTIASAEVTAVLSDVGQIALAWGAASGAQGYDVYRRLGTGPWYLIGQTTGAAAQTLTDIGAAGTAKNPPDVDTYNPPADWLYNSGGDFVVTTLTDPGARGSVLRMNPAGNTGTKALQHTAAACTAGETWEVVGRLRSDGRADGGIGLWCSLRNAANAQLFSARPADGLRGAFDWGVLSHRFTIPADVTQLLLIPVVTASAATDAYADFAEVDLRRIA